MSEHTEGAAAVAVLPGPSTGEVRRWRANGKRNRRHPVAPALRITAVPKTSADEVDV